MQNMEDKLIGMGGKTTNLKTGFETVAATSMHRDLSPGEKPNPNAEPKTWFGDVMRGGVNSTNPNAPNGIPVFTGGCQRARQGPQAAPGPSRAARTGGKASWPSLKPWLGLERPQQPQNVRSLVRVQRGAVGTAGRPALTTCPRGKPRPAVPPGPWKSDRMGEIVIKARAPGPLTWGRASPRSPEGDVGGNFGAAPRVQGA